jgi:hypothetical protein
VSPSLVTTPRLCLDVTVRETVGLNRPIPKVVRRYSSAMLTKRKRVELLELARRSSRARDVYVRDYWSPKYFARVVGPLNVLVEERRSRGWARAELSPHQNKVCMESALGILRAHWGSAISTARRVLLSNESWTTVGDRRGMDAPGAQTARSRTRTRPTIHLGQSREQRPGLTRRTTIRRRSIRCRRTTAAHSSR